MTWLLVAVVAHWLSHLPASPELTGSFHRGGFKKFANPVNIRYQERSWKVKVDNVASIVPAASLSLDSFPDSQHRLGHGQRQTKAEQVKRGNDQVGC